jgi:DNA-binding CsgD family transcriptional regulator
VGPELAESNAPVVGRESELALLGGFIETLSPGQSLVLTGGPGIGKTTLWEAGIDEAAVRGLRVVSARANSAEAQLSFAALIDLCDGVETASLESLTLPQRSALEVALLRAQPGPEPPELHAIALGFLNVLRALSADGPLLVAIDDIQWLDVPSAETLAFVARRLDGERLGFLLSRRGEDPSTLERALERGRLERLEVGPLSLGATRRVLAERLGMTMPRPLLRRVFDVTLGNPLFVLELGSALAERGLPENAENIPMPSGVEEMLGTRVATLAPPLRRLLVAVALSADLHVTELEAIEGPEALETAIDTGLLLLSADRVRASHPLLAAAAKHASIPSEQRRLHEALAAVVADAELRAKHLALAATRPDDELAATVAHAAADAAARGGRQQAVELAEHSLRLTTAASAGRPDRILELAGYLETAGEMRRMTEVLTSELGSLPGGPPRARAWLMLSDGVGPQTMDDVARYEDRALAECGNDAVLRATILARSAGNAAGTTVSQLHTAAGWAQEALDSARGADPDSERFALFGTAWVRAMTGQPVEGQCEAYWAVSGAPSYVAGSPERVAGQRLVWRGELDRARTALGALLSVADERGEDESYALARLHVCELHLRAGEWNEATVLLEEWAESSELVMGFRPKYERCRALLAAGRGDYAETERWATEALAIAEEIGVRWDGLEALRALAIAELLENRPAAAAGHLREVWRHTEVEGVTEPGVFPVAPDLVEALAEVAELDEARSVSARLRALSEAQEHPWGRVSAERCEGVIALAGNSYETEAGTQLAGAADAYDQLGLRFDAARTRLALGRAARRFKQWGIARTALEGAAAGFGEIGSPGWAEQTHSELTRVGARRPRPAGELTATELRTAELAAAGMSNKEIARQLVVTVHTVELHLSRAYAKLGIRSRRQLAQHLGGAAAKD